MILSATDPDPYDKASGLSPYAAQDTDAGYSSMKETASALNQKECDAEKCDPAEDADEAALMLEPSQYYLKCLQLQ